MERVVEVTVDNPFFRGVGFERLCDVHDAMNEVRCTEGEVLLERGAVSRAFYVVDSGSFVERTADGEEVRRLESPDHFGEVELIYNCARAASITCLTAGRLWALDGATFLRLIMPEVAGAAAQSAYTPPPPPLSPRGDNRPAVELDELMQTPALLGKGAFGAVRLAVHTISGVPYALKVMDKTAVAHRVEAIRVIEERLTHATVNGHPMVASLAAALQDEAALYLVLEYVQGITMNEVIQHSREQAAEAADAKADAKAAAAAADSGGVTIDVSEAVDVDSAWKALAKGLATDHLRYYAGSLLLALCARCASNHQTRPMTHAL